MKIIIVQENLKNALLVVSKAVATSSTLPILGNVLLKTDSGLLKISATNLEISISERVRCKIESDGAVCLPARLLMEVVSSMPGLPVTLEVVAQGLSITAEKYHTILKTVPTEDFPVINDTFPENHFSLLARQLKPALEGVLFATSTNETQVELTGVYMARESAQVVFAATDRYRLAESKIAIPENKAVAKLSVIIPSRACVELVRALANAETVNVGIGENQGVFAVGETVITTRLIDGQYPEYEAIVPKEFSVKITTNRQELSSALKAVAVFARGSSGVQVSYVEAEGLLKLSARSQDAGEGEVEVQAKIVGSTDTILFNHKYLLDMLNFLTGEEVEVKLNSPAAPVIFSNPQEVGYIYLVMPIKS